MPIRLSWVNPCELQIQSVSENADGLIGNVQQIEISLSIIDGRYWNRTSDSYRVKVVLYL